MDRSRLELDPGLWLDARRAVWLANEGVLAVADLHLGYVWSHRARGNLLPLGAREDSAERINALLQDYAPRHVVLLGDIVHQADDLPPLIAEMTRLGATISTRAELHFVRGNHDRELAALLPRAGFAGVLHDSFRAGPHLLLHGDHGDPAALLAEAQAQGGRVIFGHEHPALSVSDGVSSAKGPCFLEAPHALMLPAFSGWAAGGDVRSRHFLSPLAQSVAWQRAFPILAGKLLPMTL